MDERQASDTLARNRWLAINAARVAGVAMVVIALLIIERAIAAPAWAGYVLLAVGIGDVFFLPILLARRWRTPGA